MSDLSSEPDDANSMAHALARLALRVETLETKVAGLPDPQQIEVRINEQVKANLAPPVDPTQPPGLKDIGLPIPNVQAVMATAKSTWALLEMLGEVKMLLWMLVDRRYHMGWLTRLLTVGLVIFILVSHFVWPFARLDMIFSPVWDKLVDLVVGLILFLTLHFEMRRYNKWRSKR